MHGRGILLISLCTGEGEEVVGRRSGLWFGEGICCALYGGHGRKRYRERQTAGVSIEKEKGWSARSVLYACLSW